MKKILSFTLIFSVLLALSLSLVSCGENEESDVEMLYGKPKLSAMSDADLLNVFIEYGAEITITEDLTVDSKTRENIAKCEVDTDYPSYIGVSASGAVNWRLFYHWIVVNYYGLYEYEKAEELGARIYGKKRLSSVTDSELDAFLAENGIIKAEFSHDVRGVIADAEVAMFDTIFAGFFTVRTADSYDVLDYVVKIQRAVNQYYGVD